LGKRDENEFGGRNEARVILNFGIFGKIDAKYFCD
jgi:hypothetical protein